MDGWMGRKPVAGRRPAGLGTRPVHWGRETVSGRGAHSKEVGVQGELCSLTPDAAATEHARHTLTPTGSPHDALLSQHGSTGAGPQGQPMCAQDTPHTQTHWQTDTTHAHMISPPPICVHVHTDRDTHSRMLTGHRHVVTEACVCHTHMFPSVRGHSRDHGPDTQAGIQAGVRIEWAPRVSEMNPR